MEISEYKPPFKNFLQKPCGKAVRSRGNMRCAGRRDSPQHGQAGRNVFPGHVGAARCWGDATLLSARGKAVYSVFFR